MAKSMAICTLIILIELSIGGRLRADIVTQSFTGVITVINSGGQAGTSIGSVDGISIGSTFTGSFSYQTNNSGADLDSTASQGLFLITPSVDTFLTVNIGGKTFQKATGSNLTVQTFNNVVSTLSNNSDLLSLSATGPVLPTGWTVTNANTTSLRFTFAEPTGLVLSSDALPTSFSTNWTNRIFSQTFNANVTTPTGVITGLYIEGNLVAVPEPTSIACFSLVTVMVICGGLASRRRFHRKDTL